MDTTTEPIVTGRPRKPPTNPDCVAPLHGTRHAYSYQCRCDEAIEANRRRNEEARQRRAEANGAPTPPPEPPKPIVPSVSPGRRPRPCEAFPEAFWHVDQRAFAVHVCRVHCTLQAVCLSRVQEFMPVDAVAAGVVWEAVKTSRGARVTAVRPAAKQPPVVTCGGCRQPVLADVRRVAA